MATVTVFSEYGPTGSIKSNGTSGAWFSTVVAGTSLTATTASGSPKCGIDQANYDIYETFYSWDTSGIGADVITAVAASVSLTGSPTYTGSLEWELRRVDYGSLTTADWVAGSQWSAKTLCASLPGSSIASGYNALTSQAAFGGEINRVGDTQCVFGSSQMSGSAWVQMADTFALADNLLDLTDAKLVLETRQVLALFAACGC
jgi:hypothetical protein